jgi:hypothetical protein
MNSGRTRVLYIKEASHGCMAFPAKGGRRVLKSSMVGESKSQPSDSLSRTLSRHVLWGIVKTEEREFVFHIIHGELFAGTRPRLATIVIDVSFELGGWGERSDCELAPNVAVLIESNFGKGNHTRSCIWSPSIYKSYSSNRHNNWTVMIALINSYSSNQSVKVYRMIRKGHINQEHGFSECQLWLRRNGYPGKGECNRMHRDVRSMPKSTAGLREWDCMADSVDPFISSDK